MLYAASFAQGASVGYSQAALNYVKAISTVTDNLSLIPLGGVVNWSIAPWWAEDLGDYFGQAESDKKATIIHLPPDQITKSPYYPESKRIGLTTFETSRLPKWICEDLNKLDGLIVPSQFNKDCLIESGVATDITVIPHAIGDWWWRQEYPASDKDAEYVFGYVGAFNSRKNPEALLEAFTKAYPEEQDKVALLIKTVGPASLDNYIKSNYGDRSDIWFFNESFSEEQMLWVYSLIDCYVSAHKAEGFGLGLLQAAAMGIPVAYTNYSAPKEFLDPAHGHIPMPYTLETVQNVDTSVSIHFKDFKNDLEWATPDVNRFAELFKDFRNPKSDVFSTDVRARHSWQTVGKAFTRLYDTIL